MGTSTNPKDRIGRTKPPIELIPPSAIIYEAQAVGGNGRLATISAVGLIHEAMAFKNGAVKYNPYNWRSEKVSAMIYMGAAWRHLLDLNDREEYASDSGVHHAAHAKACLGIFIDASVTGNLVDDRPVSGRASALIAAYDYEVMPMRTTGNKCYATKLISCVMNDICLIIDRCDDDLMIAGRARATLGCYLDAMENGYLEDDRATTGTASLVIERFTEKKVVPTIPKSKCKTDSGNLICGTSLA